MGVSGAAIATAVSNTISLIFFLVVLFRIRKKTCLTISPKQFTLKKEISGKVLSVGFPAAISVLLVCFSISLLTALLLRHEGGNILAAVLFIRFKKSLARHTEKEQAEPAETLPSHRIVAISREFGSGGRTIGKEVAAQLKIPCYDSELIEKIAAQSGFAKEYVEKYGEYAVSASLYENALAGRTRDGQSDSDKLWLAQQKVITDLAKEGPCVIVGRCADFILRNIADCLTVFIHASEEKRAERIVSVYGERDEKLMQRIRDKDKKRKAYYEIYTGTEWGKADNYDLCLDSGVLGMDKCVQTIKELY